MERSAQHPSHSGGLAASVNVVAQGLHPNEAEIFEEKAMADEIENVTKPGEDRALISKYADWPRAKMIRTFWRMYSLGVLVSLAGMYAGYIDTAPGTVVANEGFIKQFGTVHDPKTGKLALNANYVSYWSVGQQACALGSQMIAPFPVDRFGRKIYLGAFVLLGAAATLIEMFARDWRTWLAGKAVMGIVMGMMASGPVTLMAEITFPQMRGSILCWYSVTWTLGQLFCNVGMEIINETIPLQYLRLIYTEWVFVGIYAIIWIYAPESPTWLITVGKLDKAKKTLGRIVGKVDGFDLDHEFEVWVQEVELSRLVVKSQTNSPWAQFFKWKQLRRSMIPMLAYCGNQLVGAAYVLNYTSYFFQQAGLKNPFIGSVIVSLVTLIAIVISMGVIDSVGRRPLMIWGTIGCCVFNFLIGAMSFPKMDNAVGAGLVTVTACWVFCYGFSYQTISWTSLVEMSTPLFRAKTAALIAGVQFAEKIGCYYVVPLILSDQDAGWGAKIGLLCGGLSILMFPLVYLYWPETSGRTYAAVDDLFDRGISPRKFHVTTTIYDTDESIQKMEAKKPAWWRF